MATKFVQIAPMPAVADFHPMGLFALDSDGIVYSWDGEHKVWVPYPTTRAVVEESE